MTTTVSCNSCGQVMSVPRDLTNEQSYKCPSCQAPLLLGALDRLIGHEDIRSQLKEWARHSYAKNQALPHILFVGRRGTGKVTMAKAFAQHFGMYLLQPSPLDLQERRRMVPFLSNAREKAALLIERLDRLPKDVATLLWPAITDLRMDMPLGNGESALVINMRLKPFTLIGIAEDTSSLPNEVLARFLKCHFTPFCLGELASVLIAIASDQGVAIAPNAAQLLAANAEASAEIASSFLSHALSYASNGQLAIEDAAKALRDKGISADHLTEAVASQSDEGDLWDESRLMRTPPDQFEALIGRLIDAMGMRARVTRYSGDGGIDVVATSTEAIRGGVFVIQCKRCKRGNMVGVDAVRELMGVVSRERAAKGILISSSDFTKVARREAEQFGSQMELVDGATLLRLLKMHRL